MTADTTAEPDDIRRKRLHWRATHRGSREMDIIFGGFVTGRLAGFSSAELDQLERMIALPDQDLLSWATQTAPVPHEHRCPLLMDMLRLESF